jgi:hypothetical protein
MVAIWPVGANAKSRTERCAVLGSLNRRQQREQRRLKAMFTLRVALEEYGRRPKPQKKALIVNLRNASSELILARRASEECAAALGDSLACASG